MLLQILKRTFTNDSITFEPWWTVTTNKEIYKVKGGKEFSIAGVWEG